MLAGAPVDYGSARLPGSLIKSTSPLTNGGRKVERLVSLQGDEEEEEAIESSESVVLVGNRKWMRKNFIDIPADVENRLIRQERQGRTALLAVVDGKQLLYYPVRKEKKPVFVLHSKRFLTPLPPLLS